MAGLVSHLLYEIEARDPVSFIGAAALALLVSGLAAYTPARRIASISPMEVMSEE